MSASTDDFKAWAEQAGKDMRANLEHWGNDPDGGNEIATQRAARFHPPDDIDDDDDGDEDEERTDYSPDQPREHGMFAGPGVGLAGAGRGSAQGVGREGGKTGPSASAGPLGRQGYSGVHPREWVGHQNPDHSWTGHIAGKSDETWKDHFSAHPDKGGHPLDERREAVHDPIMKEAFAGKKTAAELGEQKQAILTMGGPASGKGVVLAKLAKHGLDLSHFVHVDPDAVKAKLPEYKASIAKEGDFDKTFRGAANQVHEESSYIAKQIAHQAVENGHHLVIDGTGGNAEKFIGAIKKLEASGYEVHVHHPLLPAEEGNARVQSRAESSGRLVPEQFVKETYSKIEAAQDRIHAAAPNLTLYDASNRIPGDFKSSHVKVFERQQGKEPVVHDPAFMARRPQVRTDYSPDQARDEKGRFSGGGGGEAHGAGGSPNGPTGASGGKSAKPTHDDHVKTVHEHFAAGTKSTGDADLAKTAHEKAGHLTAAADSYSKGAAVVGEHGGNHDEKATARATAASANEKAAAAHKQAAKEATDDKSKAEHTAAAKEHSARAKAQREGAEPEKHEDKPKDEHGAKPGEHAHENGPKNEHGGEPLEKHNGEHGTEHGTSGHIGSFIDFLNKPLEGKEGGGGEGGGGEGKGKKGPINESASSKAEHAASKAKSTPVAHHDGIIDQIRTDDWNEELHPRVPAGGPDGGEFGGAGGSSLSSGGSTMGGGSNPGAIVGEHRLKTTRVKVDDVLAKAGMPKEKLYAKDEPPPEPARAMERAALAKVLVLKPAPAPEKHDEAKHGAWDESKKEHKLGEDAHAILKQLSPEHFEALRKYSNKYDFAMKQVEAGADRTKLADGIEKFWKGSLAGKGIDVDKMSPADKAKTFTEHFGHATTADFVDAAAKANDGIHDMFAKVAPTPGVAYRGLNNVTPKDVERILNSKTMTLDTMSSFSFNHDVAHDYATGAQASKAAGTSAGNTSRFGEDKVLPNGVRIVMRMSHKSGVNMMGASDFKKEQEVILPKGTKFRLANVTREGNFDAKNLTNHDPPVIVVHMEEI